MYLLITTVQGLHIDDVNKIANVGGVCDTEATYKKGTFHEPPIYMGLIAEEAAKQSLLIY